jgi:arylsulfatase A-like enzyme
MKVDKGFSRNNVAARLQRLGYSTAIFGKMHLGLPAEAAETGEGGRLVHYERLQEQARALGFDVAEALYAGNVGDGSGGNEHGMGHEPEWVIEHAVSFMATARPPVRVSNVDSHPEQPRVPNACHLADY